MVIALTLLVIFHTRVVIRALRRHAGLALALVALTAIAISHQVGAGGMRVLDLGSVPAVLEQFRASGRFFWPVGLTLGVGTVALLLRAFPDRAGLTLALLTGAVQFADATLLRDRLREEVRRVPDWAVHASALRPMMAEHRRLTLLPSWFCMTSSDRAVTDMEHRRLLNLLVLGAERAMPVNTMYVARWRDPPSCRDAEQAATPILRGELRLVLPTAQARDLPLIPDAARLCRPVGDLVACSDPEAANEASTGMRPLLRLGTVTAALGGGLAPLLAAGFDARGDGTAWTVARRAVFSALRDGPTLGPVRLEMELVGYAARPGGIRRVGVRVDGREAASWELPDGEVSAQRLDLGAMPSSGEVRIEFAVEDPAIPAARDGGADQRRLGFAIRRITVTPR